MPQDLAVQTYVCRYESAVCFAFTFLKQLLATQQYLVSGLGAPVGCVNAVMEFLFNSVAVEYGLLLAVEA